MRETNVIYAPNDVGEAAFHTSIFLAGSIDMGSSDDWQAEVIKELDGEVDFIFNPRRPDWNPDWKQTADDPNLSIQVNWELDTMENCSDVVGFYFSKDTKAPITFMELGLMAGLGTCDMAVYCPDGFYRQGNVEILCQRNSIPFFRDKQEWLDCLIGFLRKHSEINNRLRDRSRKFWEGYDLTLEGEPVTT